MKYAKFWIAAAAALGVAVSVTTDNHISVNDAFAIASAFAGSVAVGLVPNRTHP